MPIDVVLEHGTRRCFASALDWPGWSRSGRDPDAALDTLDAYRSRYGAVVARAGLALPTSARLRVVETVAGDASTDFGVPGQPAAAERRRLTAATARRLTGIVRAGWATFDDVVAGAPAALRKGPRGGGRDRDEIVAHLVESEVAYARKIGVTATVGDPFDASQVAALRDALAGAIAAARAAEPEPGPRGGARWPYRYAARRIAWHALDHAWEIEDKS